jgi:hypothetical protein
MCFIISEFLTIVYCTIFLDGLIQELNLGETYEIVAKVAGNNANNNEDGFIECISLSTFKNVLSRMFNSCDEDPSIELNPAIDRLYRARYSN